MTGVDQRPISNLSSCSMNSNRGIMNLVSGNDIDCSGLKFYGLIMKNMSCAWDSIHASLVVKLM